MVEDKFLGYKISMTNSELILQLTPLVAVSAHQFSRVSYKIKIFLNSGCIMTSGHSIEENSNPLATLNYIPLLDKEMNILNLILSQED